MKRRPSLPEEVLLVALHSTGALRGFHTNYALGGAVLGELLLRGEVGIKGAGRKERVIMVEDAADGGSLLDECRSLVRDAKRLRAPAAWVAAFARTKKLTHQVAEPLRSRGVLRAKETRVLWVFPRRLYLQMDRRPRREAVERLHTAIFGSDANPGLDPRTTALLALADAVGLLRPVFGWKPIWRRRAHIKQLVRHDPVGRAVRGAVHAAAAAASAGSAGAGVAGATALLYVTEP